MNVALLGGTGFVGSHIVDTLLANNDQVMLFTRNPAKVSQRKHVQVMQWPLPLAEDLTEQMRRELSEIDVVINLAGETINQRWTEAAKSRILKSRLSITIDLINLFEQQIIRPHTYIQASAIGYYGTSETNTYTEQDGSGCDFLANVTYQWEGEAEKATAYDIRLVKLRFGVILGTDGGALPRMLTPFKLFAGGPLGSGRQWMSWIHIQDVVGLVHMAMNNNEVQGAINAVAPGAVKMNELGKTLAKTLGRPYWLPAPAFALRAGLGEMSILVLKGQHVLPEQALKFEYSFKYPQISAALEDLLGKTASK